MTYNELAELFKREGGDAQVCFSVISQNQILFGNNDTKKDIISFKNEEPIKWVKEAQEEPKKKCMYSNDNYTNGDRQVICDGCEEECKYAQKEEPISEELEEASVEWFNSVKYKSDLSGTPISAFKAGANWQKLKDMGITNNVKGVVTNILNSSDEPLDNYAAEVAFIMLPANLTENYHMTNRDRISDAVRLGAQWQKEHLWKHANGDDLPEIDREVIVLIQPYPLEGSEYAVYFAHRPNPDGWDGKNITTGEVEHYTPKTYDKGGWNIPNIVYWLDVELPKK